MISLRAPLSFAALLFASAIHAGQYPAISPAPAKKPPAYSGVTLSFFDTKKAQLAIGAYPIHPDRKVTAMNVPSNADSFCISAQFERTWRPSNEGIHVIGLSKKIEFTPDPNRGRYGETERWQTKGIDPPMCFGLKGKKTQVFMFRKEPIGDSKVGQWRISESIGILIEQPSQFSPYPLYLEIRTANLQECSGKTCDED